MHDRRGPRRSRRDVLRGTAAAGLMGLLGSDAASGDQQSPPPAGAEDVRDHGAALNGTTDDADALRDAFAAAGPDGAVVVPAGGRLRLESGVVFDLEEAAGFEFRCHSPLAPTSGIGDALTVTNGYPRAVDGWFAGGGRPANYRVADPEGGDRGLVLRGVRGGEYRLLANGYRGRVLHVGPASESDVKTAKLRIPALETRMYDQPCGQAFYVTGRTAVAEFGSVWSFWDEHGPVVRDVYDVTFGHVESGWNADGGLLFDGAHSVHVETLALGDETRSVDLLTVEDCAGVHVGRVFAVGGRRGFVVSDSANVTIEDFWGVGNGTDIVVEPGVTHTSIDAAMRDTHGTGVAYGGTGTNRLRVISRGVDGPSVEVAPTAAGHLDLSGHVVGNEGKGVVIGSRALNVAIRGLHAAENGGADLVVASDNQVRISDSTLGDVVGTPKTHESMGWADERPDPGEWRVGDVVEVGGGGVYLRLPEERWTRIDGADAEAATRETATDTQSATGDTERESAGAPGLGTGTALVALAGGALALARTADD